MLVRVSVSCWSCLWDVRSTRGSGGTRTGAGFMSPHGSPLPPSSWWDTGRMISRYFLAGPLGAPHAVRVVFPVPSTTALWDLPVVSRRGIWLPDGCLEHIPLCPPSSPQAGVRLCCRSGSSLVWDVLLGAPRRVRSSGSDTSEGSKGFTASVPTGAQGSVSTYPQSSLPTMPLSSSLCWPTSAWPPSWTRAYSHEVSLSLAGKSCFLAPFLQGKGDF